MFACMSKALMVGGPANGATLPFSDDDEPPEELNVSYLSQEDLTEGAPMTRQFRYVRRVNPLDDGPVWMYVPAPEYADEPDPWRPDDR